MFRPKQHPTENVVLKKGFWAKKQSNIHNQTYIMFQPTFDSVFTWIEQCSSRLCVRGNVWPAWFGFFPLSKCPKGVGNKLKKKQRKHAWTFKTIVMLMKMVTTSTMMMLMFIGDLQKLCCSRRIITAYLDIWKLCHLWQVWAFAFFVMFLLSLTSKRPREVTAEVW